MLNRRIALPPEGKFPRLLNGDAYFKIHRENHNLDRCRAQFALVASLEEQESAIAHLFRSL